MDERIRLEYAGNKPVRVTLPDLVFQGGMMLDPGGCTVRIFQAEAPHTDDSTLIEVPGDRVLFLGDSTGGVFPDWTSDPILCRKLAETVRESAAEVCIPGHWTPLAKEIIMEDLLDENRDG